MTTALIRYQDRWATDDPVMDYVIYRHDAAELERAWSRAVQCHVDEALEQRLAALQARANAGAAG